MIKSAYIHIPFCNTICNYCDFCKVYYDKKYINSYLNSLKQEIESRYNDELLDTIYIGGGTPTSLDLNELEKLLQILTTFNINKTIEYTIESNIESLTIDKIKLLKRYGINRVSLGVQSFNDKILKELNRHHDKNMVFKVVKNLKDNGITNINIDLIYGVNNDINNIKNEIKEFLKLDIPHISCYSLIIEDNTIFGNNNREYINESIEYEMYEIIRNTLNNNNYNHYEISNYAKDNYQSIHNLTYWNNEYYYGFGLGAVSFIDNNRIQNTKNLTKYLNKEYIYETNYENKKTRMENELILGLRKIEGINISNFNKKYNENIYDIFPIERLIKEQKITIKEDNIFIPENNLYLSNEILLEFIS